MDSTNGMKRPPGGGGSGGDSSDSDEEVTMLDVLRDQKALEQDALRKTQEGWGDDTRCTYDRVCHCCCCSQLASLLLLLLLNKESVCVYRATSRRRCTRV